MPWRHHSGFGIDRHQDQDGIIVILDDLRGIAHYLWFGRPRAVAIEPDRAAPGRCAGT